jgi:hypothetical protein
MSDNTEDVTIPHSEVSHFLESLKRGRERYNTKFALARHVYPALDGEMFSAHLAKVVGPIVEAVAKENRERVDAVTDVLYDLSMELIGKDFFGRQVRYPAMLEGWEFLLPLIPNLLVQDALTITSSITNALYNLSVETSARPLFWLEAMAEIGARCSEVSAFLEAGKIVAWRAGLAHYREGALKTCRNLKPEIARAALGVAETQNSIDLEHLLAQLERDPWLNPSEASNGLKKEKRLRVVREVGAFRGFGGLFISPPNIAYSDGQFLVYDTEQWWTMTADCFGATFHRLGQSLSGVKNESNPNARIDAQGKVEMNGHKASFHTLAEGTSFASDDTTLAVTVPLSHSIYLVAFSS